MIIIYQEFEDKMPITRSDFEGGLSAATCQSFLLIIQL